MAQDDAHDSNRQSAPHVDELRSVLKSQYHAGLAMLRESIERCPEALWFSSEPVNAYWQVAYHTLYFTHLYLQPTSEAFRPWDGQQQEVQHPDGIAGPTDPASNLPPVPDPYRREQVLDYWAKLEQMIDSAVDALDLASPESGFHWYKVSKLEHQLISLRHLQHHSAQLADRLRAAEGIGVRWVGARRSAGRPG